MRAPSSLLRPPVTDHPLAAALVAALAALGCSRAEGGGTAPGAASAVSAGQGSGASAAASSAAGAASAVAGASAPGSAAAGAGTAPGQPGGPQGPYNVLFIMVDSLRADMPWAGYPRPIAPWMTRFAEQSTLYPRAYSLSSYTAKSVVPALVGKYPSEMPRDGMFFTAWPESNLLVTERAQKAGHRTLAGHGHGYFMPALGLAQGFDVFKLLPGTELDVKGVHNITSEPLTRLSQDLLGRPENVSQEGGKRFFYYVHYLDPHHEYYFHKEHPDFGKERRDLYDNEVHHTDKWVGTLVDWALAQPWGKDTAVIITADHGEGFGERGRFRHAYDLWESLVRVPLIIRVPGAAPRRIEVSRGHIDLAPTIAELMGLPAEPPFRGKSLVPEVFGAEAAARPVIADLPRCDLMDRRRALVDGPLKLIAFSDDKEFLLFDVVADPREERDLSAERPEDLARMKALYARLSAEIPTVPVTGGATLKGAPAGQRW